MIRRAVGDSTLHRDGHLELLLNLLWTPRFSRFSLVFSSLYSGRHSKPHVWHLGLTHYKTRPLFTCYERSETELPHAHSPRGICIPIAKRIRLAWHCTRSSIKLKSGPMTSLISKWLQTSHLCTTQLPSKVSVLPRRS